MRPAFIALLAALIPMVTVHLCYSYSISHSNVPSCIPYIEGCTSISRAARQGDSLHLFRALMLPTTTLLVGYWMLAFHWLRAIEAKPSTGMKIMRWLGVIGALFLILYVTFLGTEGDFYRWMRRYGVTVYFSFTALAQILLTQRLYQLLSNPLIAPMRILVRCKLALCLVQWIMGLISVPLGVIIENKQARDAMQNIVEWNFALAMYLFFFISYLMISRTNARLTVHIRAPMKK